jgi:hypothetical protein
MKHLFLLTLAISSWTSGLRADPPAVHGMLLFGNQVAYASHLPMFHAPHDYQLLLKLSFNDLPGGNTMATYQDAKKSTPEYFTLVPEVMDLSQVISGAKTTFRASIYQGHFERGGQKLGPVQVQVQKILFSARLKAQTGSTPAAAENKYFVFGGNGEYFATHLIQGRPNFDATVSVGRPYQLSKTPCGKRICLDQNVEQIPDQQLPLTLIRPTDEKNVINVGESLGQSTGVQAEVQKVIYTEERELAD